MEGMGRQACGRSGNKYQLSFIVAYFSVEYDLPKNWEVAIVMPMWRMESDVLDLVHKKAIKQLEEISF